MVVKAPVELKNERRDDVVAGIVEPEGLEPSSKQAIKTLSTCLDVV